MTSSSRSDNIISLLDDDDDDNDDVLFASMEPIFAAAPSTTNSSSLIVDLTTTDSSSSPSSSSSSSLAVKEERSSPLSSSSSSSSPLAELGKWTVPVRLLSANACLVGEEVDLHVLAAATTENAPNSSATSQVQLKSKSTATAGAVVGHLLADDAELLASLLSAGASKKFHLQAKLVGGADSSSSMMQGRLAITFFAKTIWEFEHKPLRETILKELKHKRYLFQPYESYRVVTATTTATATTVSETSSSATSAAAASSSISSSSSSSLTTAMTTVTPPNNSRPNTSLTTFTCLGSSLIYVLSGSPVFDALNQPLKMVHYPNSPYQWVLQNMQGAELAYVEFAAASVLTAITKEQVYAIADTVTAVAPTRIRIDWYCATTETANISSMVVAHHQTVLQSKLAPLMILTSPEETAAMAAAAASSSSSASSAMHTPAPVAAATTSKNNNHTSSQLPPPPPQAPAAESNPVQDILDILDRESGEVHIDTTEWLMKQDELDELFDKQSEEQLASIPDYPMPRLLENLHLFDHQVAGIRWLIHQEKQEIPSYITEKRDAYGNRKWECAITKTLLHQRPKDLLGGILADDMGLGKTLQTIGLILSSPPAGCTSYPLPANFAYRPRRPPRCTLIICPKSVAANWVIEINKHVNQRQENKNLVVGKYFGSKRDEVLLQANNGMLDVLITSFNTVASDFRLMHEEASAKKNRDNSNEPNPPKKKPKKAPWIFNVDFHRIVLDEAHTIRNRKTHYFKSCCALKSKRKLALSGTVFVNNPNDLRSLLSFLQVEPLYRHKVFNEFVLEPIKDRKESGLRTIRTTMSFVCLRRKKETVMADINLVTKEVKNVLITFPEGSAHTKTYEVLYASARACFVQMLRSGGSEFVMRNFLQVIALVLRIRQSCVHMSLVPEEYRERAAEVDLGELKKAIDEQEATNLLERLLGIFKDSTTECSVCFNELDNSSATILRNCKHIFCGPCLNQIRNQLCPMCRAPYSEDDMIDMEQAQDAKKAAAAPPINAKKEIRHNGRSPKFQALLKIIENEMKEDEKGVIFSQWTSSLNLLEEIFRKVGHTFTRIDGTMTADQRIAAIEAFESDKCDFDHPRFILCSIMACGTGINLTRGNCAFMLDPWWNGAVESQAMDRIHRIGQKRPVRVYRLLMKDSIEERMVDLQDAKTMLGRCTQEKMDRENMRKARMTFLRDLFQVESLDEDWKDK